MTVGKERVGLTYIVNYNVRLFRKFEDNLRPSYVKAIVNIEGLTRRHKKDRVTSETGSDDETFSFGKPEITLQIFL